MGFAVVVIVVVVLRQSFVDNKMERWLNSFFQLVSLYSEIQLFDISIRSCWGRLHLTIRIIQTTPAPRDYRKPRCVNISPFNGCRKVSPPLGNRATSTSFQRAHTRERSRRKGDLQYGFSNKALDHFVHFRIGV